MTTFEDIIHLLFTLWSECELPELTRQSVGQVPTLENKHHPTIPIYYIYICWNIPPKIHTYVVTYRSFLNWFKSFANSTKDKNLEFHFSNVLDSVMQNKSKCKSWNRVVKRLIFWLAEFPLISDKLFNKNSQDNPPLGSFFFGCIFWRSLSKRELY